MKTRSQTMLNTVQSLLSNGYEGTQEELCQKLETYGLKMTQSTLSRVLRQLGVVKTVAAETGRSMYRLPHKGEFASTQFEGSLQNMILKVLSNGALIVIQTTPGSAPLIASFLDQKRPPLIMGTIAGDDTIFVAPTRAEQTAQALDSITKLFNTHA